VREDCDYYAKIPRRYREYWVVSPITQAYGMYTPEQRIELWEIKMRSRDQLIMRVLNRRLPCINSIA
jgi:hypothetical protein